MPDSLAALDELGVPVREAPGTHPFRGIRFLGDRAQVEASFPGGEGIGIRRTVLHRLLVERAAAAGVSMLWGTHIDRVDQIRARWIIGADGQQSRVRRWAGLEACTRDSRRYSFRRHYSVAPWTDCMEIYWGRDSQMYVTPVGPEEVCVALISRDPHLRMGDAAPRFPRLMARLAGARPTSKGCGGVSASRRLRRVCRGNVALIGDASGSVDAITGEGLCLSFRQAIKLAQSLEAEDLAAYQEWHRRAIRRPAFMADLMLLLDAGPRLREQALRALSSWPRLFARLLAIHVSGGDHCLENATCVSF